MKSKLSNLLNSKNWSLQGKIGGICVLTNIIVMIVNVFLLYGINNMSNEIEMVYRDNLNFNELSRALVDVQDSMTEYLTVKTSDSLENFYRSEQTYSSLVMEINDKVTNEAYDRMEFCIRNMSVQYLEMVNQTIEAKRGRNVEKYRVRYENATRLYDYIKTYIKSLNDEQFEANSQDYIELSGDFHIFETVSIWTLIAIMIGNIVLTIMLTGNIISPLKKLAGFANEVAAGNFEIETIDTKSNDEIGTVSRAFNSMVISIQQYIEQLRSSMETEQALRENELKMEAHLKEAQLKYLQAQINPHFLFNTLNAGAQLAMMEDADRTYEYIQNVSEIFRYTIRKETDTVTVKEELELIDHYIYVLNVRFSGDIHYKKEIDEGLLNVKMPSMILQPIIENCVNHGIREMEGLGEIKVRLFGEDDNTYIIIEDNGKGMEEETIRKILQGEWKNEKYGSNFNGIGMDNVIARMRLFTDNYDSLQIFSEGIGKGTRILIMIPDTIGET